MSDERAQMVKGMVEGMVKREEVPTYEFSLGEICEVEIGPLLHGGYFLAHHNNRTIFVRGGIVGERVKIEIEEIKKKFVRAKVIEVITPSKYRVSPECRFFKADLCGGCKFLHIDLSFQRDLKASVIKDAFRRIAKIDLEPICHPASSVESGYEWRTRMDFTISDNSKAALFAPRSHRLTEIDECLIAVKDIDIEVINSKNFSPGDRVRVSVGDDGQTGFSVNGESVDRVKMEVGKESEFLFSPASFWQPHKLAATRLTEIILTLIGEAESEHVLDLYGGVGLFTEALRKVVGPAGRVTLIESDRNATADARSHFAAAANVEIIEADVEKALRSLKRSDRVILDPPRSGVTPKALERITSLGAKQIIYISCDPATLARDSASLVSAGYRLDSLEGYDFFPMTEHIESVANFIK